MASHIELVDLSLSYHWRGYSKQIFSALNLRIETGCFVSIVGGNGSGKSSLIKLILGLAEPQTGQVNIAGEAVRYGYPLAVQQGRIAYFSQDIQEWFFGETVGEELVYDKSQSLVAAASVGLNLDPQRAIGDLSGGERQSLGLVEFMSSHAELLLLDEPSSFLDHEHALQLQDYLTISHKAGKTILHVTQYPAEISWGSHVLDLDAPQPAVLRI